MDFGQKIYLYCERGQDPSFWAEPLNAVTNAAFLIAALAAARDYAVAPPDQRGIAAPVLIAITFVIGIGSFLFHTYATRWAVLADTIPIGLFMLAYFAFVLRYFVGLSWLVAILGIAAFVAALRYGGQIECRQAGLLPITAAAGARCLNGTVGYLPAFGALAGSAALLGALRHPAWRLLALASVVFLASMTFRTLDLELCGLLRIGRHAPGTHFLWHTLNAVTLYLLLRAAIRYGNERPAPS